MRSYHLWRDRQNRIYAQDNATGDRYNFMHYAAAISDNPSLQEIVADEMISDVEDFAKWINGEVLPSPFDELLAG